MRGDASIQVFLTRPRGRNGSVPARLRALGMSVHELPVLELLPLVPSVLPRPGDYDVVVFVSRYAAQRYLQLLAAADDNPPLWPAGTVAATVGASSARALGRSGAVPAACIVHPPADAPAQDSETLLALLLEKDTPLGRVLIVRGSQGREWLGRALEARGARVDFLPVYERVPAAWPPDAEATLSAALSRPAHSVFLLTSSEGVRELSRRLDELNLRDGWPHAAFVVIHERIGATLQSVLASTPGTSVRRLELCTPDDDSIVQAIQAAAASAAKP
ncbi:uroporphyrinogen-III synthase [Alcaligenaceae bacterium]|nr:uroporphyrinogen-III synthase [Alcaligenaceae bacterium]